MLCVKTQSVFMNIKKNLTLQRQSLILQRRNSILSVGYGKEKFYYSIDTKCFKAKFLLAKLSHEISLNFGCLN